MNSDLFDKIPKSMLKDLELQKDVFSQVYINIISILYNLVYNKQATLISKQDCFDVISNSDIGEDTYLGAKLSTIGYALPYFISEIGSNFHLKNHQFNTFTAKLIANNSFLAFKNMNDIIDGKCDFIEMPNNTLLSGFYIRTPIRLWNSKKERVYNLPNWDHQDKLLNYLLIGNTNVYVVRTNASQKDHTYECNIIFRGTSSVFHGAHQYGHLGVKNTQVYRLPQYDPLNEKFYPGGSTTISLFYYYYVSMVNDVWSYVMQTLKWLGANSKLCTRINVTGHSMGGALTLCFCYLLKHRNPKMWDYTYFKSYASPLSCNDKAVKTMEQFFINSEQKNKYVEIINTDDFVNAGYLLGGDDAILQSLSEGKSSLATWIMENYWQFYDGFHEYNLRKVNFAEVMRVLQLQPEIAISSFLRGAFRVQNKTVASDKKSSFRLGQRLNEMKKWGNSDLKDMYNDTFKLVFCDRRIADNNEYVGKSHTAYMDLTTDQFYSGLRLFEDDLYRRLADTGLRDQKNKLRIVGLFPKQDEMRVKLLLKKKIPPYHPKHMLNQLKAILSSQLK